MRTFLAISGTGLTALLLHPLRSVVTVLGVLALLAPYLAGLGLSMGLEVQAEEAVRFGADLYVTGRQFGREAPIPLALIPLIRQVDGVTEVVPRIIGEIRLGKERYPAVLVGVPLEHWPAALECIDGRLFTRSSLNELVVGTELARRLHLEVGSVLPPFYHNSHGDRLSRVVGLFRSDVSLWQANLVLTSFDTATAIFNGTGLATDLLVSCRPGEQESVARAITQSLALYGLARTGPDEEARFHEPITAHVTSRADLEALLPKALGHREGIFNLHFVLAFAIGIPVVLVTSGLGLAERRREIGILKATGWQTDEILLRGLVESFFLSLAGASLALILAFVWLRGLNGYGIAQVFLAGAGAAPSFPVPCRLTPLPALLGFLLSFAMVLSGTLYSSWRSATVPPREALR
jgi:ABC-type lipoprotein release transport system permease subunit